MPIASEQHVSAPTAAQPAVQSDAKAPASLPTADALRLLEQTLHTLLAPLEYPDWQTWQVDVHRRLLELTGADSLCVFTPLAAGPAAWYAPHVSDADLARYAVRVAADPTWDVIERGFAAAGRDVAHEAELVDRTTLETSAFYHEFLRPNRIFDIVTASADFGGPQPARLHFSSHRRLTPAETAARTQLVRTILPAFRSGLATWRQLGEQRAQLSGMLNALSDAVLLYDTEGTLEHANPAAARLLESAEASKLRSEAQAAAWAVAAVARRVGRGPAAAAATMTTAGASLRSVRIGTRTVQIKATLAPSWVLGRAPGVIVTIEAATSRAPDEAELKARYGLTARELEVARLVAEGLSNNAIADKLGVSFFTARNHVERLLAKLGADSRARAGAILREG